MEESKEEREHKIQVGNGHEMPADKKSTPDTPQGTNSVLLVIVLVSTAITAGVWYQTHLLGVEVKNLVQTLHDLETSKGQEQPIVQPVSTSHSGNDEPPRDCYDIQLMGEEKSGTYKIYPEGVKRGVEVYCDMTTDNGGWLVFQRRLDGSTDFSQDWDTYLAGFGDINKEFWIGNELLHTITKQGWYQLRVDMSDFEGEIRFAKYKVFAVGSGATGYQLTVSGYSGDAGNSLAPHNTMKFSTHDVDMDKASGSCAKSFKGGFWYNNCHFANPTGEYLKGEHETVAIGVNWFHWKGYKYSLKTIEMKIKPL